MADASAYLTIATALQAIIADEFEPEGFTAIRDNLHESLGRTRVDIGIAPVDERDWDRAALANEIFVEVRFYGLWTPEISPETVVDPADIAGYATRFADACRRASANAAGSSRVWYFSVVRITYPSDPTGNKSRFHATIRAYGNNPGLVETTD